MPPNKVHAVYTPEPTVCHSTHFYASSTMRQTLAGIVHTFVCHQHVTNTTHPRTFSLLHRLACLYYRTLVQSIRISKKQRHHVPDLAPEADGTVAHGPTVNFLALCTLCVLGDVLDERSYMHPQQGALDKPSQVQRECVESLGVNGISQPERQKYWQARGCALHLITWFRNTFSVSDSSVPQTESQMGPGIDLPSRFIVHVCQMLLRYKRVAELNGFEAAGFCKLPEFEGKILAALGQDSAIASLWAAECNLLPSRDEELCKIDIQMLPPREFQLTQKNEGDITMALLRDPVHTYGPLPGWCKDILIPDISALVIRRRGVPQVQLIATMDEMEAAGKTGKDTVYNDFWVRARKATSWLASDVAGEIASGKAAHKAE